MAAPAPDQSEADSNFPAHCVQAIQGLFTDVSQVGAHVINLQGEPLTQTSHPCSFCQALSACPAGRAACRASWKEFAANSIDGSKFFTCHAGLHYVGASIIEKGQPIGLFLVGPFYWQAAEPHEKSERLHRLAGTYDLDWNSPTSYAGHTNHHCWTACPSGGLAFHRGTRRQSILIERTGSWTACSRSPISPNFLEERNFMKKLVILGAGTAGTMVANRLARLLDMDQWK